MVANHNFIAKDYLRAFDLKSLFVRYTVYYSKLNYPDGDEPLSSKDRHELTLKIQETLNDMSLLVLKMKETKPNTEALPRSIANLPMQLRKVTETRMAN